MNGEVSDIERLGAFSVVTVSGGACELRAIAAGHAWVRIGDRVGIGIEPAGLHVFAADSGLRID